jgi:ATP-dependent DNA ligase
MNNKRKVDDYENFPFTIVDNKYVFNMLYGVHKNNNIVQWQISCGLINKKDKQLLLNGSSIDSIKMHPGDPSYIENGSINLVNLDLIPICWTEKTILVKSVFNPTFFEQHKNIGKSNERNELQCALIHARNEYEKKVKAGFTLSPNEKNNDTYYPMSAHKFDLNNMDNTIKAVKYASQPKLDGLRVLMRYTNGNVKVYSRKLLEYTNLSHISNILFNLLKENPNIILDGEIYKHDLNLQTISGLVRNSDPEKVSILEYHIFDLIDLNDLTKSFRLRFRQLKQLLKDFNINTKLINLVHTKFNCTLQLLNDEYANYLKHGYEGQMVRLQDSPYETSVHREIRSKNILKRKEFFDSEYEFVGIELGLKGKSLGTFIAVMKTESGIKFNATMLGSIAESKEFAKKIQANLDSYVGKYATIQYNGLSIDNVPLFPKFKCFIDQ